jgi:threonine dehydrogenase-like Zn-dependent dehydrogenase
MLALYRDGLRLRDLISHRLPFQEAANAFELFASGKSAKVMLEYPVQ